MALLLASSPDISLAVALKPVSNLISFALTGYGTEWPSVEGLGKPLSLPLSVEDMQGMWSKSPLAGDIACPVFLAHATADGIVPVEQS